MLKTAENPSKIRRICDGFSAIFSIFGNSAIVWISKMGSKNLKKIEKTHLKLCKHQKMLCSAKSQATNISYKKKDKNLEHSILLDLFYFLSYELHHQTLGWRMCVW